MTRSGNTSALRVLFVCTGNICRSPSAEMLLRARLDDLLGPEAKQIEIGSAGLGTPGGWELDPPIDALLRSAGIGDTEQFRSRRVDAAILADADLVLTGTKQHRLTIGAEFPDAYARTFTMREAARLLCRVDQAELPRLDLLERGRALITFLQRERGTRALTDEDLDVADPHGRRQAAYETMFSEVRGIVDVLTFVLAPATVRAYSEHYV